MEVLNIANVNISGEEVLNDRRLLELILRYPFLFSPALQPYGDEDYDNWAWQNITAEFNSSYEGFGSTVFTTVALQRRWCALQPIVLTLNKVNGGLHGIPESFQKTVKKVSALLEMPEQMPSRLTDAQRIVIENIGKVQQLPLAKRRSLEAEVMELILNAEIESKSTIKMGIPEFERLDRECADFLRAIGFNRAFSDAKYRGVTMPTSAITSSAPLTSTPSTPSRTSTTTPSTPWTPSTSTAMSTPMPSSSAMEEEDEEQAGGVHESLLEVARAQPLDEEEIVLDDSLIQINYDPTEHDFDDENEVASDDDDEDFIPPSSSRPNSSSTSTSPAASTASSVPATTPYSSDSEDYETNGEVGGKRKRKQSKSSRSRSSRSRSSRSQTRRQLKEAFTNGDDEAPLDPKKFRRFVPLKLASRFVRPCVVRLKRYHEPRRTRSQQRGH